MFFSHEGLATIDRPTGLLNDLWHERADEARLLSRPESMVNGVILITLVR